MTLDLDLPFSASGLPPSELRALPEAVAAAERLRAAIVHDVAAAGAGGL